MGGPGGPGGPGAGRADGRADGLEQKVNIPAGTKGEHPRVIFWGIYVVSCVGKYILAVGNFART
jgi:hypothetical protein